MKNKDLIRDKITHRGELVEFSIKCNKCEETLFNQSDIVESDIKTEALIVSRLDEHIEEKCDKDFSIDINALKKLDQYSPTTVVKL